MRLVAVFVVLVSAGWLAGPARGDDLWVGSGETGAIQIRNATITRIDGGSIYFTAGGRESSRELARVQRIRVEGEPALNAAEEAYMVGKWNDAVDAYHKTFRSTTKPWLKDWATLRLFDAGNRSGRFDAATTAYIAMLLKDPQTAADMKPQLPNQRSTYLDGAATEVNQALNTRGLSEAQRQALLNFLMDLHRARGDRAAEQQVANQLEDILARDPQNPAAAGVIARRRLLAAARALDAREYQAAINEVNQARDKLVEPQQQAEALFILAEAAYALADPNNMDSLKDAAVAYMRVVAHFKDQPGRPHVAQSLLRTAQIHEQLREPQTARTLYEQVVQQHPDEPAAQLARQSLQRLDASPPQQQSDAR